MSRECVLLPAHQTRSKRETRTDRREPHISSFWSYTTGLWNPGLPLLSSATLHSVLPNRTVLEAKAFSLSLLVSADPLPGRVKGGGRESDPLFSLDTQQELPSLLHVFWVESSASLLVSETDLWSDGKREAKK